MHRLRISLLGSFCATLDGEEIARFGVKAAQALLAYLALHAQVPCRREALAGLLWPDQPERTALQSLRQALSRLRAAIGDRAPSTEPPFLTIDRETIQLNPESDYWLDADTFADLIAACAAHQHRRAGICAGCGSDDGRAVGRAGVTNVRIPMRNLRWYGAGADCRAGSIQTLRRAS